MKTNIRIMTSNIWGDYFGNPVEVREMGLYEIFMKYSPDIIGMQEATVSWHNSRLFELLRRDYTFVPTDETVTKWYENNSDDECVKDLRMRGNCVSQNFVPLIFKTEKYELADFGWHHFSETSDPSKCVTWAVLKDRATGLIFCVCATHFWWMTGEKHDRLRDKNAHEMLEIMISVKEKYSCPVFAFGDFNCNINSTAFSLLIEDGCIDLQTAAIDTSDICSLHGDPVRLEDGNFKGQTTDKKHEYSIDHIICLGNADIIKYDVITDTPVLDATDHSPVYADIVI